MPEIGSDRQPQVITISTLTIVKVAVFLLAAFFLYMIRDIIALFFMSLVLASIINPLASWFQSKGWSRGGAVLLLYLLILLIIGAIVTLLVPAVINETRDLLANADAIWASFLTTLGPLREFVASHGLGDSLGGALSGMAEGLNVAAGGIVATIRGLVTGIASLIIVLVVAFYLVVSEDALKRLFRAVAPEAYQPYLVDLFQRIEKSIGGWVRGQLILSLIVGVAVYVALQILGVKYALVLALAAGVAEAIPYVGPVFSAIPAILIALTQSPLKGLLVAIMYVVIQQVENHVLVPKIMQKVTGLHPIVSIFAMLIGVKVAGLVGALLAIPVAMMLGIVVADAFHLLKSHR
ncbi:MAG TPA: AI-2E family transporter [Candidatus Baltobacteraceae bacterium]|nr:AI-2E family transporter [Candidatus Baltobacteraceae bacterium]